jgi:hypothetical protein
MTFWAFLISVEHLFCYVRELCLEGVIHSLIETPLHKTYKGYAVVNIKETSCTVVCYSNKIICPCFVDL